MLDELADGKAGLEPDYGPARAGSGGADPATHDAANSTPPVQVADALQVSCVPARRVFGGCASRSAAFVTPLFRAFFYP